MTKTKFKSHRWLSLILLCAAQFMMVLDFSIVGSVLDMVLDYNN